MTRIDFYKLASGDPRQRRLLACRIVEKAWRTRIHIYVLAADLDEARALDDMLWTFRQGSFIPHAVLAEDGTATDGVSILIGVQTRPPPGYSELLVNMKLDHNGHVDAFERAIVVLNEDPRILRLGRQRYKEYREAGHQIETHFFDASGNAAVGPPPAQE
ncbi:DNA polymerase III subunit chi [Candidatus Methylospira mobilis]|uniref:DNA polymerase III subunit chi n=1 Tax=Candidatus Methylospira mobilis TaxID=1808979 RepID=A0A5Q0BIJ7_9GAMM|nr:DNA polymerase III subunit chi [Candidatus Methylospira mobilis]QFY42932.1 DNA polymerase III subunit chi [Candidatus Methylospira mobilis]WNV03830.1 DNA polymerase III subunit chi [Candidatus Methylospira mobilis]